MPGPVAPAFRATLKLLNKKNTSRKIWHEQKIITIFAAQKIITMRCMPIHIESQKRFSLIGAYTVRGACFAFN
jgi:hypothetical protein